MLNSKLMYTAVTRAIKRVYLIGQDYAFKRGCTNIKETARQTFLMEIYPVEYDKAAAKLSRRVNADA